MTSTNSSTPDSLALVNSFYGPGATACWYLTCLSCLVSWSLHPKKRESDSVTADFIALVTFPVVAAAHLISQVHDYPPQSSMDHEVLEQINAAISASLTIAETYLILCVILLVPNILIRSPKRILLLALTGIFCFATEAYLFFTIPSIRNVRGIFHRSFIIDSLPLLVMTLSIVVYLTGILFLFIYVVFICQRPPTLAEPAQGADPEVADTYHRTRTELHMAKVAFLTYLSLPFALISAGGSVSPILRDTTMQRMSLVNEFFPETNTGIMELDQAVALLTGMTVLGLSLYSAADQWYRDWWEVEKKRRDHVVME
jgi:hypothetical protein